MCIGDQMRLQMFFCKPDTIKNKIPKTEIKKRSQNRPKPATPDLDQTLYMDLSPFSHVIVKWDTVAHIYHLHLCLTL